MKVVFGRLGGDQLAEIASDASTRCERVEAAVAYAHGHTHPFFEACRTQDVLHLTFYGLLDERGAVDISVLKELVGWGAQRASVRLVRGNFHPKVIWWRGVGAYVGSANLTHKAWFDNVEAGIFLDQAELETTDAGTELEAMFAYLREHSLTVDEHVIAKLEQLDGERQGEAERHARLRQSFEALFGTDAPPAERADARERGERDETLACQVGFFIQRADVQHMLVLPAAYSDSVSAFLGVESVSGHTVSWREGSFVSSTVFTRQDGNNEWKMTIPKRQDEARPLFDFALRVGSGPRYGASLTRRGSALILELDISTE